MSPEINPPRLPGSGDDGVFTPGPLHDSLVSEVLPGFIARSRWFGGKARRPRRLRLRDSIPFGTTAADAHLLLVEIEYLDGDSDTYLLLLQVSAGEEAGALLREQPGAVIGSFEDGALLGDALHSPAFRGAIFELMRAGGSLDGKHGRVVGIPGSILGRHSSAPDSRALSVEQSNSSIIYGDHIFLKIYRRLEAGVNPDAEILHFLGERGFPHVPPFGGAIEYHGNDGDVCVLSLALGLVPNDGDAWTFTLRHLAEYFAGLRANDPSAAQQLQKEYLHAAAQLGAYTGRLHVALASDATAPGFAPEPYSHDDALALSTALRLAVQQVLTLLAEHGDTLDADTRQLAEQFRAAEAALVRRADGLDTIATAAVKTRTHGDYHLGQVLHGPEGFVIIDFEGEPLRALEERRRKMSPFRDVAGMLRSFHYAAHAALKDTGDSAAALTAAAESWAGKAQEVFLGAWRDATKGAIFRGSDPASERLLLDAFLLEKALYEIRYEVNNRPGWLAIPLRGSIALLRDEGGSGA